MTLTQTKLVGLTLELDVKAAAYQKLCRRQAELQQQGVPAADPQWQYLADLFQKNLTETRQIKAALKKLQTTTGAASESH